MAIACSCGVVQMDRGDMNLIPTGVFTRGSPASSLALSFECVQQNLCVGYFVTV